MGRGRWKEQVKCKDWSALDWQMSKMQHYTLPWSECRLDDLFSFSNIEFMKKKIYIPLNYWGFYFKGECDCGRGCVEAKEWSSDVAIM